MFGLAMNRQCDENPDVHPGLLLTPGVCPTCLLRVRWIFDLFRRNNSFWPSQKRFASFLSGKSWPSGALSWHNRQHSSGSSTSLYLRTARYHTAARFNLIALFLFLYKRRNEGRRHFWYERRNERRRNENIRHRRRFQYRFDFIVINLHDVQYWFVFFVFHEHAIPVFVVLFLQKRAEMPKQDSAGAWREKFFAQTLLLLSVSLRLCLRRQLVHSLIVGCPNADRFLLAKLFEKNRQA